MRIHDEMNVTSPTGDASDVQSASRFGAILQTLQLDYCFSLGSSLRSWILLKPVKESCRQHCREFAMLRRVFLVRSIGGNCFMSMG